MDVANILKFIDEEIQRLQTARDLIADASGANSVVKAKGNPTKKRRRLSAETRKRIADAQRARWSVKKKAQK
jgi:hypothetical protein